MTHPKIKECIRFFPIEGSLFHVYDPSTSRHFRMGTQEVGWLRLVDGNHSRNELVGHIPVEYFNDFFGNIDRMGLLESSKVRESRKLLKLKLFRLDPTALLTRLKPWASPYSRGIDTVTIPLAVFNIAILILAWPISQRLVGSFTFGWLTVLFYLLAILLTGIVHEMSHALVGTSRGVNVTGLGMMLIFFHPAFYADVSGINHLQSKDDRISVLLAGVKSNNVLITIGLVAFLLTAKTQVAIYFFVFASLNVVLILINLVPFVEYDGYYVFQELVAEPNFARCAFDSVIGKGSSKAEYVTFTLYAIAFRLALVFVAVNSLRVLVKRAWNNPWIDFVGVGLFAVLWIAVIGSTFRKKGVR